MIPFEKCLSITMSYIMHLNRLLSLMIIVCLVFAMDLANVSQLYKVTAETGIGNDVFKVTVTLFDITNSTKDITTLVNVKDETKVKVYNAENPEGRENNTVSYVMTFPNLQVNDGEPYTVCTVSVEDFELVCMEGNNSPVNRPEFVDINVSEQGAGSMGQIANADQDENAGDQDGNDDEEDE